MVPSIYWRCVYIIFGQEAAAPKPRNKVSAEVNEPS